jgi:hypothetical protein
MGEGFPPSSVVHSVLESFSLRNWKSLKSLFFILLIFFINTNILRKEKIISLGS